MDLNEVATYGRLLPIEVVVCGLEFQREVFRALENSAVLAACVAAVYPLGTMLKREMRATETKDTNYTINEMGCESC